jgi:hypothetical protein
VGQGRKRVSVRLKSPWQWKKSFLREICLGKKKRIVLFKVSKMEHL